MECQPVRDGLSVFSLSEQEREPSRLIRDTLPEHLLSEWRFFNILASTPVFSAVADELIARGVLSEPTEDGAEGIWMRPQK